MYSDEAAELKALTDLASECEGYLDWTYGETLIAEHAFVAYAEQLAEDGRGTIHSTVTSA